MALSVLSKHWAENDLLTRYFDADFLLQERINLQMLQRKKQQKVIACYRIYSIKRPWRLLNF